MSTRATIACKQKMSLRSDLSSLRWLPRPRRQSPQRTLHIDRVGANVGRCAIFVRSPNDGTPNDSPTATARLSCPLAQPCMNSPGTAERSTSMSLKTRLGIVISFDRDLLSHVLFTSLHWIGDSPVRSKTAGIPVKRWKRSTMTSQYSVSSSIKNECDRTALLAPITLSHCHRTGRARSHLHRRVLHRATASSAACPLSVQAVAEESS